MPAARFEITKDKAGKYRFHLKAGNGEIIAASQAVGLPSQRVTSSGNLGETWARLSPMRVLYTCGVIVGERARAGLS
jgi:Domain of unknown function (DUF1508)